MSEKKQMVLLTLEEIYKSVKMILKRFESIQTADDFLSSDENIAILDSISMRLLAIGEGLKNIDKLTDSQLLIKYPEIEWKNIKGLRDILSHHYFDINIEIIFDICTNNLKELESTVQKIILDLR